MSKFTECLPSQGIYLSQKKSRKSGKLSLRAVNCRKSTKLSDFKATDFRKKLKNVDRESGKNRKKFGNLCLKFGRHPDIEDWFTH